MPPQMTNHAPRGSSHQSSVGCSDTALSRRPPKARKATRRDAERHGIPDGYTLTHWDPDEEPIKLLGTIFDSSSLGKYFYDLTRDKYGPYTPMKEISGDLWELLIRLYGNMKISEQFVETNEMSTDQRLDETLDLLKGFIKDGEILKKDLDGLLRRCEKPMLRTDSGNRGRLGREARHALVDALFGRDQLLEETENFMQNMRNWIEDWEAEAECAGVINPRRKSDR